jgi:arsenate reductase-like glutaredoxin family protein
MQAMHPQCTQCTHYQSLGLTNFAADQIRMIVEEYLQDPTSHDLLQTWLQRLEEAYQATIELTNRLAVFDKDNSVDFVSMRDSLFNEHNEWYANGSQH